MEEKEYLGYIPDYIDRLLPNQVFVFGSNAMGYHTEGASAMARKRLGLSHTQKRIQRIISW